MIKLEKYRKFNTTEAGVSYRILSGEVNVLVSVVSDKRKYRKIKLCNFVEGDIIPSVHKIWKSEEHENQLFLTILAKDVAEIEEIAYDSSHISMFLKKTDIEFLDLAEEGDVLIDALVNFYAKKNIYDNDQIKENLPSRKKRLEQNIESVTNVFSLRHEAKYLDNSNTDSILYNAVAFICAKRKMNIVSYQKLIDSYEDNFTIYDVARLSGFICREVELPKNINRIDPDPFIIMYGENNENVVACFKQGLRFVCFNTETMEKQPLSKLLKQVGDFSVYSFTKPLSGKKIGFKDLLVFTLQSIKVSDIVIMAVGALLLTYATSESSRIYEILFDSVIKWHDTFRLPFVCAILIAIAIGNVMFGLSKSIADFRLRSRMKYNLQTAMYERLFHMPDSYFRKNETAAISFRIENMPSTYTMCFTAAIEVIIMFVYSAIYIVTMSSYSSLLANFAVGFVLIEIAATILVGYIFKKYQQKRAVLTADLRSLLFQTFSNIETVRTLGREGTFINRYLEQYSKYGKADLKSGVGQRLSNLLISMAGCGAIISFYYLFAMKTISISTGSFLAFMSAFSAFSSSMLAVSVNVLTIIIMIPMLKSSSDVLQEIPEDPYGGSIPKKLDGNITVTNVSFSYGKGMPAVLKNINMQIKKGEYIGIVGGSGSGKSTLMKLLLGLDRPNSGVIIYDSHPIDKMNKTELRRKIGTVMQNGVLFSGSIESNINLSCPDATEEDTREAARIADILDDIDEMPMGFKTVVSEQARTISGGQKQRIMIARAVASKPKILFFDEATSSLDNISQAKISDNLAKLDVTRVVIAHRLSTVKKCDRIYVLKDGEFAEIGTYDELMKKNGIFAELAKTQIL